MFFKDLTFSALQHETTGAALLEGVFAAATQLEEAGNRQPPDFTAKLRFWIGNGPGSPDGEGMSLGRSFAAVATELDPLATGGFRVVVEGRQRTVSALVRDEIYRIGREAIVNAFRHSRAGEIVTEIEYRSGELRITVRDNGCGIDPGELRWERSALWGLQGMRERAERIGARLRIMSRVALGTEVELCVPARIAFEQLETRSVC